MQAVATQASRPHISTDTKFHPNPSVSSAPMTVQPYHHALPPTSNASASSYVQPQYPSHLTQNQPRFIAEPMPTPAPAPVPVQAPVPVSVSASAGINKGNVLEDLVEISDEDLAMLDAIEQQVLATQATQQHAATVAVPNVPPHAAAITNTTAMHNYNDTTNVSEPMTDSIPYCLWSMDDPLPLYFRLKITTIERQDSRRCIRLLTTNADDQTSSRRRSSSTITAATAATAAAVSSAPSPTIIVELFDDWYHFVVSETDVLHLGDVIHVVNIDGLALQQPATMSLLASPSHSTMPVSSSRANGSIVVSFAPLTLRVDNEAGLVIIAPDTYVSPTKVADSCQCERRGVLVDRFRSFSLPSVAATLGKVRHYFIEVRVDCILAPIPVV